MKQNSSARGAIITKVIEYQGVLEWHKKIGNENKASKLPLILTQGD